MGKRNANGSGGKVKWNEARQRYEARYYVHTPKKKQRIVTSRDRDECQRKLTEAMANRDQGLNFDAGTLTVGEYLPRWLEDSVKGTVRDNSYQRYEAMVRIHLIPELGRVKLKDLSPSHVRGLYKEKLDSGLSPRTVKYIHQTINKALKLAVMDGMIPRNVAAAGKAPKPDAEEIVPLDIERVRALLEAARGERLEALFIMALATGMRRGELLGLKWRDIDMSGERLSVRRTYGVGGYGEPKNKKSKRSIKIGPVTMAALSAHRQRQNEERLASSDWQDEGLVFPGENGQPMQPQRVSKGAFGRIRKRAGLPESTRFHDCRHSCATFLLRDGWNAKYVQEVLGHSTIAITLDTYSHVMPGMDDGLADTMDAFIT